MPTPTTAKTNLQRLALVRLIVLACQFAAILYAGFWLRAPLAYPWLIGVALAMAAATVFTFWRLGRPWPVTDPEYFAQLLLDVASLGALLYFSGGATNPFISYLLVPLSIAAAILPSVYTVALALIGVGIYSALLFFYQPLAIFQPDAADLAAHVAMGHMPAAGTPRLNAHIFGMWCNFAISSLLITYVVARMAATVREQQAELNRHREDTLHNEQLLAVATLAAGTAHELGTPLGTMTVLLDDMRSDDAGLQGDIELLKQQVTTCRTTLKNLVNTAQSHSDQSAAGGSDAPHQTPSTLTDALHRLLERWQVLRPRAAYQLQLHRTEPAPRLLVDETLQQAIINLLNNAADTDSGPIDISADWDDTWITLHIRDRGPGIALELADKLGKPFVTTKHGKGLGLGLFLSHATIERHGGDIRLFNHPDGGTDAVLRLPVLNDE